MTCLKAALALACLSTVAASPAAPAPAVAAAPAFTVQQARVEDSGHAAIPVAIWVPASGTRLPLIVMSHGTGGGPMGHADTAQALAEAGFVVVAPMHPGDNFQDDSAVGRPEWLADRARHVSKAIDFMYGQWEGRARLLPGRVGVFGFSAGATTALIASGGNPDLGRVAAQCASHPEFVCQIMRPAAASGAQPQWVHDRRIAAAVVAAPGLGFAFAPSGLAGVHIPVQLWVGGADETVPYATNGALVREQLARAVDFHRVEDGVHLSFLAPCGPQTPPALCHDKPGFDRAAFHRTFNDSVAAFFRARLAAPPTS